VKDDPQQPDPGALKGTQTLMRGLDILDSVVEGPVKVADLARKLDLTRSTTHRLAQALLSRDYLSMTADGFELGPKLLMLGTLVNERSDFVRIARPYMERLSDQTGYCVFIGRREGNFARHLERVTGRQRLRVSTAPGDQRLIVETGLGKALLLDERPEALERLLAATASDMPRDAARAWLDGLAEARARGVVLHESRQGDGVRSVAAPVRNAKGEIVMALSIAGAALYLTDEVMEALVEPMRATALQIGAALGYRPAATAA
jgi:DNA-binding IclR family transcriptional regulator